YQTEYCLGNTAARCSRYLKSYIMYHGTTLQNAIRIMNEGFSPSYDGMLGPGVYVTRSFEKASHYPVNSNGERLAVLKLVVRVGRVKRINYQDHPLQKTWYRYGYDTAWVPPNCGMVNSGLEENCVYDPRRITVLDVIPNNRFW
uniref:Poly [ADP-ribose] polymerase n=1 Tax=Sinocyclocheilus anshuiensis TaxID=1608454 RepID=A0A671QHL2_9TELE